MSFNMILAGNVFSLFTVVGVVVSSPSPHEIKKEIINRDNAGCILIFVMEIFFSNWSFYQATQ
jgi:hypothetical protein